MAKLAIIIINHKHGDMIKKAINSIDSSATGISFKVFVINNVPDSKTTNWLADAYPDIHRVDNVRPQGFARNINQVIKHNPDFDFYLSLNPDVVCFPGMITNLIAVMTENLKIGVLGPELLNFDDTIQPSRRRFANFRVLIFRALHLDAIFKNLRVVNDYLMTNDVFDTVNDVDWVTGAVMLLRKQALDQVGLMDERFFMYFEDEDLCCRMWQNDWKVCYVRSAQAYHTHLAEGRNKILSKTNFYHLLSAVKILIKYRGRIGRCTDTG
jgi:GT2 family glycosyltransferase